MLVTQQEAFDYIRKMLPLIYHIVLCLFATIQGAFPDDPKPCKYSDAKCIVKIIGQLLKEKSGEGDVSLNLDKLDPFSIDTLSIQKGKNSPINIDLVFTNNTIYGLKNVEVTSVRGFSKNLTKRHELRFSASTLSLIGPYSINGRVLVLPISGRGVSNFTFANTDIILAFNGKAIERNGEKYLEPVNFMATADPVRLYYNFTNLFNGDKVLGDNMNLFLNENWESIFQEVKPELQIELGNKLKNVITKVFSHIPYNKLLVE